MSPVKSLPTLSLTVLVLFTIFKSNGAVVVKCYTKGFFLPCTACGPSSMIDMCMAGNNNCCENSVGSGSICNNDLNQCTNAAAAAAETTTTTSTTPTPTTASTPDITTTTPTPTTTPIPTTASTSTTTTPTPTTISTSPTPDNTTTTTTPAPAPNNTAT